MPETEIGLSFEGEQGFRIARSTNGLSVAGGTQTLKDFQEFRAEAEAPTWALLSQDEWLFTTPAPTSGPVLAFVVSVLDNFRHEGRIPDDTLSVHRLVEALKFGFARRFELGDPEATEIKKVCTHNERRTLAVVAFAQSLGKVLRELASPTVSQKVALSKITESAHSEPGYYGPIMSSADDHGSGHVCIVAANGDALCLVSSINTAFGSHILSKATGIWYNNDMNDFSTPHDQSVHGLPGSSSSNEIRPGLRPVSSLCPTVVVDGKGDVLVAATATGGPLIISALAQVLVRSLWMGHTVKQAIDAGRVHNQLFPEDVVQHEDTADVVGADVVAF
ncbi:hypothetical protein HPB49_005097 [Dermacentor silvarum]|uniref:Uncharacterized protein n=1 Tax=Dermacentor silvarum TaxID=543639 RepID=A0ACB8CJE4_DERSI|nr:hypothetical protein HPB49_005097 [Dermacentor silvarum]